MSADITFFNGYFYYTQTYLGVLKMQGATNYVDVNVSDASNIGVDYQLRTAPLYSENFGSNVTMGVELLSKTDLYTQTSYKLVSNLGQATTNAQTLPNQGTGVQNPFINIGADANYIQVDISGTTTSASTLGFELNAMNLWSEKGGVR